MPKYPEVEVQLSGEDGNATLIAASPMMLSALERIASATMASTNSGTLAEFQSWVRAVAQTAIADTKAQP